jgi:hypothetical protein
MEATTEQKELTVSAQSYDGRYPRMFEWMQDCKRAGNTHEHMIEVINAGVWEAATTEQYLALLKQAYETDAPLPE